MLDQKFWGKYFQAYDILNQVIPYQELIDDILNLLKPKKGEIIFDAGSGTGNISIKVKEYGSRPVSLDFSEEGQKRHIMKDGGAEVYLGDLTKPLPFKEDFFDGIVSNNVIYALPCNLRPIVFKEFFRILKPGGRIVIANVHTEFSPSIIFFDHFKKNIRLKGIISTVIDLLRLFPVIIKMFYYNYLVEKENKTGRYNFINREDQSALLEGAGFKVLDKTILSYSGQSYIDKGIK